MVSTPSICGVVPRKHEQPEFDGLTPATVEHPCEREVGAPGRAGAQQWEQRRLPFARQQLIWQTCPTPVTTPTAPEDAVPATVRAGRNPAKTSASNTFNQTRIRRIVSIESSELRLPFASGAAATIGCIISEVFAKAGPINARRTRICSNRMPSAHVVHVGPGLHGQVGPRKGSQQTLPAVTNSAMRRQHSSSANASVSSERSACSGFS